MASDLRFFSKPYLIDGMGSLQTVYEAYTTQLFGLGTKGVTLDGRVFYYASNEGAAIARGTLCRVADSVANHVSIAWASGGAANQNTVTVTLGATAATANQYAGGWLQVIDGTTANGQGQLRRIVSHPAALASATLELTLDEPFETTMAASEITLKANEFSAVVTQPGNAKPLSAGVPAFDVSAGTTNTQYFWLQTYGPALVVGDASVFLDGSEVVPATAGTADAGQVTIGVEAPTGTGTASNLLAAVGTIIEASDATSDADHRFVMLKIRS